MRRREFIRLVGGAVAAWPVSARAQQPQRMRRIGVLMNRDAGDQEGEAYLNAFQHSMRQLGWIKGLNLRIDTRWGANDIEKDRKYASELVALAPDIILTSGTLSTAALQR
jgi:putative ABC transport system substrate-binding protein